MGRLIIGILASISCYTHAVTILLQPGCYEVRGEYLGYESGLASLRLNPGQRGEHILHVKEPLEPLNLMGLKVQARVLIHQTGRSSKFSSVEGRGLITLKPNSDIYSSWRKVGDETNCKHI